MKTEANNQIMDYPISLAFDPFYYFNSIQILPSLSIPDRALPIC